MNRTTTTTTTTTTILWMCVEIGSEVRHILPGVLFVHPCVCGPQSLADFYSRPLNAPCNLYDSSPSMRNKGWERKELGGREDKNGYYTARATPNTTTAALEQLHLCDVTSRSSPPARGRSSRTTWTRVTMLSGDSTSCRWWPTSRT